VAFLAVLLFAFAPGGPGGAGLATGVVVGGAALAVGGFLGLLFGVPRPRSRPNPNPDATGDGDQAGYQANTNLTEISDWLTKIIVGVSLIELGTIRNDLIALVSALAPGFGSSPAAIPFVAGLLVASGMVGFLAGYLLARIYLPRVFSEADLLRRVTEVSKKTADRAVAERARDTAQSDAEAIRLIEQALSASALHPSQEALDAAVASASPVAREYIFNRAYDVRTQKWQRPEDKELMALTIPVFRALIKADDREHRPHAQLGYALKDQLVPDNEAALEELTKAIELRGSEPGWEFYEFNRALTLIRIDVAAGRKTSISETKERIVADLRRAMQKSRIREIALGDPELTAWATANKVNLASLIGPD